MAFLTGHKIPAVRACRLLGISRRWRGYQSRKQDQDLSERLLELARRHPRSGYRMLHQLLLREAARRSLFEKINVKRVRRLCVKLGLKLPAKRRRKRRGIGVGTPVRAEHPNHVWAYDFVFDRCENGRQLKILTVVDEFTRECLAVAVEHRMGARGVCDVLARLMAGRGVPKFVRSDNGPEFIARALMKLLAARGVSCRHIEPGSPWQNGRNERFNGTLRSECTEMETFYHQDQARAVCELFRRHYNTQRPHSSLGYQTPVEFARRHGLPAAGCVDLMRTSLCLQPTGHAASLGVISMGSKSIHPE